MGRHRIPLTPQLQTELRARISRGESAEVIHAAIGPALEMSLTTLRGRLAKMRKTPAPPARMEAPPPPESDGVELAEVPDEVPANTPIEQIDKWLKRVNDAADRAEQNGNLAALGTMAARAVSLTEAKRKATPLPRMDPNDDPDVIELGDRAEGLFFKLIDELFKPTP